MTFPDRSHLALSPQEFRDFSRGGSAPGPGIPGILRAWNSRERAGIALTMSEDSCRTRSQKRALERDSEPDNKKLRMDKGILGSDLGSEGDVKIKADPGAGKIPGMLKSGEVKATIKVELPAGDEPVDMSTSKGDCRRERRAPSPDVIVLSDNEPSSPRLNGLARLGLPEPGTEALLRSPEQRERLIKQLQEELRLEEAKLVLLKKLRQSQSQKETPAPKPSSSRIPGTGIPPPLLRGGQAAASKLGSQQSPQIVMPPLVRGAQQIHSIRQHSSTGPPPLLLAPRASVPSVQIQGQRIIQQGLIRVANVPSASLLVNIPQVSCPGIPIGNGVGMSNGQHPAGQPAREFPLGMGWEWSASRRSACPGIPAGIPAGNGVGMSNGQHPAGQPAWEFPTEFLLGMGWEGWE
ncbi:hypothetical protein DV515_00016597 [Chloebia gouldiae]|uniref:Transcriptional repressor p66 coiled-coil MBD2-interaction domain-containing protein n=1 Tax=Chloebia gouldiae TaxID=44316 RepID=A0A3L8RRM5_CHLGU|nr:hypothetical protein DV515_00016597 [Chloebia gouldiae]